LQDKSTQNVLHYLNVHNKSDMVISSL